MRRLVLLFALAISPALSVRAQTPSDSTRSDPEANEPDAGDPGSVNDGTAVDLGEVRVRPRLSPSALYSANRGFGIGGGVAVDNLGWRGSQIGVDLAAQQHYLSAGATLFTADPYSARVFGALSANVATTNRRKFYGVGPFTSGARALYLTLNEADVDAHLGVYPFNNTALLIQPGIRYLVDRTGRIREDSPATLESLSATSQAAVRPNIGDTRSGISAGIELTVDLRDWPSYPKRGVVVAGEARRFFGLDTEGLTFNRYALQTTGYLPLYGRTALIGSLTGVVTRQGDSNDDGVRDDIPYYYLPTLDERVAVAYQQERLTGRDVFAMGLGIRVPLVDFIGVYGIDAVAIGYLGNVYDDVFRQFSPSVGFGQDLTADPDGRASLRPALGLGLGLVNLDKERVVLGTLVGIGAGGVTVASLRIAYNLRDSRPLFR